MSAEPDEGEEELFSQCPQIWCISSTDNIIVVGTSTGRVEFWEATSGQFSVCSQFTLYSTISHSIYYSTIMEFIVHEYL